MPTPRSSISFSLLHERWIPVLHKTGRIEDLSLLDALRDAGSLRIEHQSPLVVVSLHRLLLAFLHQALGGPRSLQETATFLGQGFPTQVLDQYAAAHEDRFDLFHDRYPFFQQPGIERPEFLDPVAKLDARRGSFSTNFLYREELRHEHADPPERLTAAEAACQLVAHQTFALGGLLRRFVTSVPAAPFATHALSLVQGAHLHETLCLNLLPKDRGQDSACWEREPLRIAQLEAGYSRPIRGIADGYTWQSRSVLLNPEADGAITTMYYAAGTSDQAPEHRDPMTARTLGLDGSTVPLKLRDSTEIWTRLHHLVPDAETSNHPSVIENALALQKGETPLHLEVFGVISHKSKLLDLRRESLTLPHKATRARLQQDLGDAHAGWQGLQHALTTAIASHTPNEEAVSAQLRTCERAYWRALEDAYTAILQAPGENSTRWKAAISHHATLIYHSLEAEPAKAHALRGYELGFQALQTAFPEHTKRPPCQDVELPQAARRHLHRLQAAPGNSSVAFETRFLSLLDANEDELLGHLEWLLKTIGSSTVSQPILSRNLRDWQSPGREGPRRWAHAFYSAPQEGPT